MRRTSFIPCALLLSALAACQPSNKISGAKLNGTGMDMFAPVGLRLHPLSRIVPARAVAEARLELTDQFGDIGKGVGNVVFELFVYDSLAFDHKGRRLGQWSMSLATPDENREHWDAITRTYLFKLPLEAKTLDGNTRFLLTTAFTLPDGDKLSDSITLPAK